MSIERPSQNRPTGAPRDALARLRRLPRWRQVVLVVTLMAWAGVLLRFGPGLLFMLLLSITLGWVWGPLLALVCVTAALAQPRLAARWRAEARAPFGAIFLYWTPLAVLAGGLLFGKGMPLAARGASWIGTAVGGALVAQYLAALVTLIRHRARPWAALLACGLAYWLTGAAALVAFMAISGSWV